MEAEAKRYESKENVDALLNAFSPRGKDTSYHLQSFVDELFEQPVIEALERDWQNEEETTLATWLETKENFHAPREVANATDAQRYVETAGLQSLMRYLPKWCRQRVSNARNIDLEQFPSLLTMLYSQYYRLFDPNWAPRPQEVTDVTIMAAAPYVDVVITEVFQATIFEKVRSQIGGLAEVEIATLRNLKPHPISLDT